jgi:putative oxidoreductase
LRLPDDQIMTASPQAGLLVLRLVVASLILIHGLYRVFSGGVDPFGQFLGAVGFPLGTAIAWTITVMEIVGSLALAAGFRIRLLSLYFAAELTMGIFLVHLREGWFVVGGGRNGVEFSVLLIAIFLVQAWTGGGTQTDRP